MVAEWKYREVENLSSLMINYPVVGIVGIGSIPAPQLQKMRETLREIGVLRVSRNRLIKRALEKAEEKKKGIKKLSESIEGETAIIAAKVDPFKLFKHIKETRTNAPAKGGELATKDIEVKAGETPFKPGPIVGELQRAGIPAAIEGGKVVIKKDKVVVKAGERIPRNIAQLLTRLEIYPIEIGLKLRAVYEDGNIYTPDILDIDVNKFINDVKNAFLNAFKLAISRSWITRETLPHLLGKASAEANALALEIAYPTKENIKQLILNAYTRCKALSSKLNIKEE